MSCWIVVESGLPRPGGTARSRQMPTCTHGSCGAGRWRGMAGAQAMAMLCAACCRPLLIGGGITPRHHWRSKRGASWPLQALLLFENGRRMDAYGMIAIYACSFTFAVFIQPPTCMMLLDLLGKVHWRQEKMHKSEENCISCHARWDLTNTWYRTHMSLLVFTGSW